MATLTIAQSGNHLKSNELSAVHFTEEGVGEFRKPENFTEVVSGLTKLFSEKNININHVKAYLNSYDVKKEDWQNFVTFDDKKYTRNLIWEGNGKFNIMLVGWNKNQASSIHDHSKSHCFMKMLDGNLTETVYEINKDNCRLETKRRYQLEKNTVAYTNDSFGLHRISNDSEDQQAVSLHIYSPPFQSCQQFEEEGGQPKHCEMTYTALFKEQFCRLERGLVMRDHKVNFNQGQVSEFATPQTMSDVVDGLMHFFSTNDVNTNQVKAFMESYKGDKNQWQDYAIFDQYKYTRNLIHEGNGKFNLILVCWNKNQSSTIHDHSNSHCFMKMLDGSLSETLYNWPTEEEKSSNAAMKPIRSTRLKKGSVAYINDSIGLHRVGNNSEEQPAVSLHVYSPPFQMCQIFNEKNGGKMNCNVTYHTKFGEKVHYCRS